ncbi:protein kinase TEL1 [Seminavis robusta]|uniref:non-specific serine/threonine protein kinase n=1 Tax=Seminavis robusta TaxID=568900 RepID=A0A9N8H7Y4_9STRA|nr:protein kinase TEL1 [Seminavis robusta]|eukprot:Sro154_g070060.1 protein kinase TEL1 (3675) ;mRNA; f:48851-60851
MPSPQHPHRSKSRYTDATALYEEIRSLTQKLGASEKRVTKRRETAKRLLEILSKEKNRQRLHERGLHLAIQNKGYSHAKAHQYATGVIWSPIINTAFASATYLAHERKGKLDPDDVKLPLRLLHYSDSGSTSGEGNQARLETACRLEDRDIKRILKFCIDMFNSDIARRMAEMEIMNTLIFLCERVEFVATFRPSTELISIMKIVEDCLDLDTDDDDIDNADNKRRRKNSDAVVAAARIFGSVLESCQELGVALHLFVSEGIQLVSRWCEQNMEEVKGSPRELSYLFRGINTLMRFHPEQAIQPLQRYGAHILRYAKRAYQHSTPINRHALHGYFIAHIIVGQQAATLRGLMPGELGDLGEATLTAKEIGLILSIVLSSLTAVQPTLTVKNRISWNTLDVTIQRHLELCARLLACAQRQFLVDQEWMLLEDPNAFFVRIVKEFSRDDDEVKRLSSSDATYPSCSPAIMAKSPWATQILAPLIQNFPLGSNKGTDATVPMDIDGSNSQSLTPSLSQSLSQGASLGSNSQSLQHPLLEAINVVGNNEQSEPAMRSSRALLLIIAACAEAFPSGRCWTSTSHKHWFPLNPENLDVESTVHVNCSSPTDFAILVHVVSNVLEASGGSNGDQELQILALLCLIRLSAAHRGLASLFRRTEMSCVAPVWRKVWAILFASNMRYSAYTAHAAEGSCGELVVVLIAEIIQGFCTDPTEALLSSASMTRSTFLYRKQAQVWALPAFRKGNAHYTTQAFELLFVFLHNLCLSDDGKDALPDSPPSAIEDASTINDTQRLSGRRYRLVCLCLHALDTFNPVSTDSKQAELIKMVTACLSALVNGKGHLMNTTSILESQNRTWMRSSISNDLHNRFCFTELPQSNKGALHRHSSLFEKLWVCTVPDPGVSSLLLQRLEESVQSDCVLQEKSQVNQLVGSSQSASPHMDYVSTVQSNAFLAFVLTQVKRLLRSWNSSHDDKGNNDETDPLDSQQSDALKASTYVHCLWLKVLLSLCKLRENGEPSVEKKLWEDYIIHLLKRVKSDLHSLCENRDEFYAVFEHTLQILLFLSEFSATVATFEMSSVLRKSIAAFDSLCESLLLSFSGDEPDKETTWDDGDESMESASESEPEEEKRTSVRDLLEDSDDDDVVNKRTVTKRPERGRKGSKRKASLSKQRGESPRKKRKQQPCPPDSSCASLVGSIVIALKPSVERCELVVDCLLQNIDNQEVDLSQAYHCLELLSDASVVFHDNAVRQVSGSANTATEDSFRHRSVVSVFCDVLDAFRASAPKASSLHMLGFQYCCECVRLGESDSRGIPLNADESRDLVERLMAGNDDDSLKMRPYLRCDRLSSSSFAFEAGSETFRVSMESVFPKILVIPSVKDLSSHVRREACGAVAAALRVLSDKKKVVKSVQNLLPPIALTSDKAEKAAKGHKSYRKWHASFKLGSNDTHFENRVWEDAIISMEAGSIDCLSVIAGVNADTTKDIVYDFVKLSSRRPELEAVCFRACSKIAAMTGYRSTDALLRDQGDSLVGKWLESGETLAEIPLLLSSPKLLGLLLRTGQQARMYSGKQKQKESGVDSDDEDLDSGSFDVTNLRDVATDQFCARHKSYLVPQMIVRVCSAVEEVNGEPQSAMTRLANDKLVRELSVCLRGNHDDATVRSLLQGRMHDIEALCAPMAHGNLADFGTRIMEFTSSCLSEDSKGKVSSAKGSDKPHLAVRRILEVSGMDSSQVFPSAIVHEAFAEAISTFVAKLKPAKDGDILSAAGTSLTECFLYARQWLSKATLSLQKEKRWGPLSVLFDLMLAQVREKRFKQTQLAFGVNVAIDVVLDRQLNCIRGKPLGVLKQVLNEVIDAADANEASSLKTEFLSVCRRLVGSLMKTHQESQQELLETIKGRANTKLSSLRRSVGLLGYGSNPNEGDGDVWGWDVGTSKRWDWPDFIDQEFKSFEADQHRLIVDSITGTFDLLIALFEKAEVLGLGIEYFVGCMPPFSLGSTDQDAFSKLDKRYCAQTIASDFIRRSQDNAVNLSQSILFALGQLQNRSSWMDEFADAEKGHAIREADTSDLTISQWMLKAELLQLENKLRRWRMTRTVDIHGDDLQSLIRELSFVCGASCPQPLQTAASRCLGEMDIRMLGKRSPNGQRENKDWLTRALDDDAGSVLLGAQAKAIEVLAGYLQSGHSGVAIAAFDTIVALLSTQDGSDCWQLVDAKTVRELEPVLSKKKRAINSSRLHLSKLKIKSIRAKTGLVLEKSDEGRDWCWNKSLWLCEENVSYESWICDLVPALIECCYRGQERPGSIFFSYCQTIASIAPNFAETVFFAMVFDLLEEKKGVEDSPLSSSRYGSVLDDTWMGRGDSVANRELSSCFEIILGTTTSDPLAVCLALDTVDLLRRATQTHFQKSENHKRNSNAISTSSSKSARKTSRSSKNGSEGDKADDQKEHNKGLDVMLPWKGVPYGTVLMLSGGLVVKSCIRVKRYESAVFYSELYFESCFAGSSAIMQRLAQDFSEGSSRAKLLSRVDISGFYDNGAACDESEIRERAISALGWLSDCFREMKEEDSFQAVARQLTDLKYSNSDSLMMDDETEVGHVFAPSLNDLQKLDSFSNLSQNQGALSLQTADTIESLGLRNLLQRYIGSMAVSDAMSPEELQRLREKWFESRLYSMNWNRALLDGSGANDRTFGQLPVGRTRHESLILSESNEAGFHEAVTNAMSDFARGDLPSCQGLLKDARSKVVANEDFSMRALHGLVERLQFVNDLENLAQGIDSPQSLLKRWGFSQEAENDSPKLRASFDSAEFSPHMHEATLRILRFKQSTEGAGSTLDPHSCLIEHLSIFSRWCRDRKFLSVAEATLQRLRGVLQANDGTGADGHVSLKMVLWSRLEEASLCYSKGEFTTAIRLSQQLIRLLHNEKKQEESSLPKVDCDCLLADALVSCGNWLSENKIEPAETILNTFLLPSSKIARRIAVETSSQENGKRYLNAQIALARLTSGMYDSVAARVKSTEWQKAGKSLAEREQELRHCEALVKESRSKPSKSKSFQEQTELVHYQRQLAGEIKVTKEVREKTSGSMRMYLAMAVKAFSLALEVSGVAEGSDMSRHVFRLVFLWLKMTEGKEDFELTTTADKSISRVPSYRYVPLTTQLFAQLGQKDRSPFQATLHKLVERMCLEHPYHCLVQLISVCNGKEVGSGVGGRGAEQYMENVSLSPRVKAATEIASRIRKAPSYVGELLDNYQTLMSSYIQLANAPTAKLVEQGKTKNVALAQAGRNNRLDRCLSGRSCLPCVLTKPPPVRTGHDYGEGKSDPVGGERIQTFDRPKIVICQGSQGGRFRQLVKGEDEIRQDAVMEQVFTYVNELMSRRGEAGSPGTKARSDLNLVTYNIIPLSPASGVLEWVENSMTFGDSILDGKTSRGQVLGTHSRYYPGEWGHARCRQHYAQSPSKEKRETFSVIYKSWSPSFRFFFMERFGHSLKDWYTAKMRYTKSVASSSIVGHILGIGDRHTNNILVSQITGEVIHIDFGIVFEQGRVLAVPEVVPFRLTRNIVDGMGPTGTEGVFTKSAEATAAVLRENANALLTILSAVASDPLYRWSVSPVEARRRQQLADDEQQPVPKGRRKSGSASIPQTESTTGERNEAAELVLAKIREKLQGYEEHSVEGQSIEGQVQLLINSARDPNNLCVMFAGWAPWV